MPSLASADGSDTRADAWGTVELSGSDWLGGNGINVYSNGATVGGPSPDVYKYVNNKSGVSTQTGIEWQCVELINRLYLARGWISSTWWGDGNQLYANAPSGLDKEPNGSITYLNPGDVITLDDGGYGHAGIVNSVGSDGSVRIVNQNTAAVYSSATFSGHTITMNGWAGYTVQGVIHAPSDSDEPLSSYPDGTFLRGDATKTVYVMAGGSPMGISTWRYWGEPQPTKVIPQSTMDAILRARPYPKDGTFIKKGGTKAILEIVGGAPLNVSSWRSWGDVPQHYITIDPWAISNQLRDYPKDGSFIKSGTSKAIMEIAGDSALNVSSWSSWGGVQPYVKVDPWAISHDLRPYPFDGTFIKKGGTKAILEIVGGSFLDVSSWNVWGGPQPYVTVDPWAIDHDLLATPKDGTFIKKGGTKAIMEIVGDAPLNVSSWDHLGGLKPYVIVDPWAVINDLLSFPRDGTLVVGYGSGKEYQIVNQTPVYVSDPSQISGTPTEVDDWAIVHDLGVTE